jgi:hypothetical protein
MASSTKTIDIRKINALFELERIGWEFEPKGDNEVSLKCPVHKDEHPSVSLNVKKNLWICHTADCGAKGDIVSLLAHMLESSRQVMIHDLSSRYDFKTVRTIRLETVEKHHAEIWKAGPLLKALKDRGVTDEMIREARLGYFSGRVMIPVFDTSDRVINVRRYLPGAPGNEKMLNTKGYSTLAIYQPKHLKFDTIWICGGEIKALVAGTYLRDEGIGAVSVTAGEGSWDPSFTKDFKNKRVYICFDIDKGGIVGAQKVATQVALAATSVHIIKLPLDKKKYPKGDINDWIGQEGATKEDLLKSMESAEEFKLAILDSEEEETEVKHIRLIEAIHGNYLGRRISCDTIITAMDTTPFLVAKTVLIDCVVDGGKSDNCSFCPVRLIEPDIKSGFRKMTIKPTSPGILDMINVPSSHQEDAIKRSLQIPVGCKTAIVTPKEFYTVIDARLTPQLHISGDNRDHIVQSAFLIVDKKGVELNIPYTMEGRMFPHPKTQQAILLMDKIEEGADSLISFKPSLEELECLTILRPKEWTVEALDEMLKKRYADLSANITRIYKRDDLHLAFDLAYYSCLYFQFDGRRQNGLTNILIVGDSSQGKSETATKLMGHYQLGVRHDCKNASSAGLLGGLQQLGTRWFVSWGVIPMHDRRLVIMEEIKGAHPEVIGRLTDMRSSGIAELSKIEKRRAHARTRLVMISNPRSGRQIAAYNFGVEALKELIGTQEDIRRFDFAIIPAATQINPDDLNRLSSSRPQVEHTFTSDICKRGILWAWTRTDKQIKFEKEAERLCLQLASKLCDTYSEALPLCDKGTMRYKLARLSVALAAMSFSTYRNNSEYILVRNCHLEYIYNLLNEEYSKPEFGYFDFSKAQVFTTRVINPDEIKTQLFSTKYPQDFINQLIHTEEINLADICDWCEIERDMAQKLLSFLVRKHALYRIKRWYVKTSEFISLLKQIKESGEIEKFRLQEKNEF